MAHGEDGVVGLLVRDGDASQPDGPGSVVLLQVVLFVEQLVDGDVLLQHLLNQSTVDFLEGRVLLSGLCEQLLNRVKPLLNGFEAGEYLLKLLLVAVEGVGVESVFLGAMMGVWGCGER